MDSETPVRPVTKYLHELHPEIDAEPARTLAREARQASIVAEQANLHGSLDPDEALALFNASVFAASVMRVRERELKAVFAAKGGA